LPTIVEDEEERPTSNAKFKRIKTLHILVGFGFIYTVVLSSTLFAHRTYRKTIHGQYGETLKLGPKIKYSTQQLTKRSLKNGVSISTKVHIGTDLHKPKIDTSQIHIGTHLNHPQKHERMPLQIPEFAALTDSKIITSILKRESHFPSLDGRRQQRLKFKPGQLDISREETLRHCFAHPDIYRDQFPMRPQVTMVSDPYQVIYMMVPKSGSSTGRWIMEHVLDGEDEPFTIHGRELMEDGDYGNYTVLTFIRDPLSRFFSSYDEAYLRHGPWFDHKKKEKVFLKYMTNKKHPYPYLYENMTTWDDYQDAFCPPQLGLTRQECRMEETKENGTLAERFERFVWDYDGLHPFDLHLRLQVLHISNPQTGRARRVDEIYTTENTIDDWKFIVEWFGEELPENGEFQARSVPRRFDTSKVSLETKQRICNLAAIDYCCLNLQLPPECESDDVGVFCALDKSKRDGSLRIQPWLHPHQVPATRYSSAKPKST